MLCEPCQEIEKLTSVSLINELQVVGSKVETVGSTCHASDFESATTSSESALYVGTNSVL